MEISLLDALVAWVLGQGAPLAIDLVNRRVASSTARLWVSILGCMVLGGLMNLNQFQHVSINNVGDVLATGGLVFASATSAYKTYYEKSAVQNFIRGKKTHFDFSADENAVGGSTANQPGVQ